MQVDDSKQNGNYSALLSYGIYRPPEIHFSNTHTQQSPVATRLIFWSDPLSTLILYVCEQRRFWRDCADAQRRLAWAFAVRLCDKYNNLMSWLKSFDIPHFTPHFALDSHIINFYLQTCNICEFDLSKLYLHFPMKQNWWRSTFAENGV